MSKCSFKKTCQTHSRMLAFCQKRAGPNRRSVVTFAWAGPKTGSQETASTTSHDELLADVYCAGVMVAGGTSHMRPFVFLPAHDGCVLTQ